MCIRDSLYLWETWFEIGALRREASQVLKKYAIKAALMYGWALKWYIIVSRDAKKYTENECKLLENTAISFAGVIGHKDILDTEKNKKYIKNW